MVEDSRFAGSESLTSLFGREVFSPLSPFSDRAVLRRLSELSVISESGRLMDRSAVTKGSVGGGIVGSGDETAASADISSRSIKFTE